MALTIDNLRIGMRVSHPRYGVGVVKGLTQHTADISFDDAPRTLDPAGSDLVAAEPSATRKAMRLLKDSPTVGRRELSCCNRPIVHFSRKRFRSRLYFTRS